MDLTVLGQATRPKLVIADAVSSRFSRSLVWSMVWGDDFNRELAAPISAVEESLSEAKEFDSRRANMEKQLAVCVEYSIVSCCVVWC